MEEDYRINDELMDKCIHSSPALRIIQDLCGDCGKVMWGKDYDVNQTIYIDIGWNLSTPT